MTTMHAGAVPTAAHARSGRDRPLAGQIAVVTGGARGLGLAICERLSAAGAQVASWDLAHAAQAGAASRHVSVDVTDPTRIAAALTETEAALGPVTILINNAGIAGPNAPTWDYDINAWRRVIDIDLTGAFLVTRAALAGMRARGYGRVVNIASIAGKEGNPNACAYSAAKAGLIGFTKALGKELAQTGVLVNCVTPAAIETELFAQMSPAHVAYMREKIPMGRFGRADELAAMVAWLSSPECSFSTGAVFDLSGGCATY